MDPLTGALIIGGLSAVGGIGSSAIQANAQADANQMNMQLAKDNRNWQQMMSSTAYERAMNDMKTAGLNPMLAYSQGGASTPSGNAATVEPAATDFAGGLAKGVNSARDSAAFGADLSNKQADTDLAKAKQETEDLQHVIQAHNARTAEAQADQAEAKTPAVAAQSKVDKATAEADANFVKFDSISNRASQAAGTIGSAAGAFFKGIRNRFGGGSHKIDWDKYRLERAGSRGVPVK